MERVYMPFPDQGAQLEFQYYSLKIFIESNDPKLHDLYKEAIIKQQRLVWEAQTAWQTGENVVFFDAGFDIFIPNTIQASPTPATTTMTIDHHVKLAMELKNFPVGYTLIERSSTGKKTPWSLANKIGLFDSAYRGGVIGQFDRVDGRNLPIKPLAYTRLLQVCAPDITWPIFPVLVNSVKDLGITARGEGGFGSTGA